MDCDVLYMYNYSFYKYKEATNHIRTTKSVYFI